MNNNLDSGHRMAMLNADYQ